MQTFTQLQMNPQVQSEEKSQQQFHYTARINLYSNAVNSTDSQRASQTEMHSEHKNKYTIVVAWSSLKCLKISPWHTVVVEFCLLSVSHCQNSLISDSWLLSHSQNNLISVLGCFHAFKTIQFQITGSFHTLKMFVWFQTMGCLHTLKTVWFETNDSFHTLRKCLISDYWLLTHSLSTTTTTKKVKF